MSRRIAGAREMVVVESAGAGALSLTARSNEVNLVAVNEKR